MRTLSLKVALACLAASLLGILLVAAIAVFNPSREFNSFVFDDRRAAVATYLQDYYREHGSWTGIILGPLPLPEPDNPNFAAEARFGSGGLTLADANGRVVVAGEGALVSEQLSVAQLAAGEPIVIDGLQVGTLVPVPSAPDEYDDYSGAVDTGLKTTQTARAGLSLRLTRRWGVDELKMMLSPVPSTYDSKASSTTSSPSRIMPNSRPW